MVALLLQAVGVDHIMSIDLHAAQIEGFFHTAVQMLSAVPVLSDALRSRLPGRRRRGRSCPMRAG